MARRPRAEVGGQGGRSNALLGALTRHIFQCLGFKHGGRRYHQLIKRYIAFVTLQHLGSNGSPGQVKVSEVLEFADANAEGALIELPNKFRAVDSLIGPLKRRVVWPPPKSARGHPQRLNLLCRQSRHETLHHIVSATAARNPVTQRRVPDGGRSLKDIGVAAAAEDDPHMAETGVCRLLYCLALCRGRR